jgi:cell division protein ZapA (FtsZ GTPase activity inhibitor)
MGKRVEVQILNKPYTFIGEDEERLLRVAQFVDGSIKDVIAQFGIVNTLNAVVMTLMNVSDEYLELKQRVTNLEDRTLKLLRKVEEEVDVPCGARDRW